MAKLIIRSGPQVGMEFSVDRPSVRLGRGSASDIVLQSTQSSRQHAEISQRGDQFLIRDLGSTNGTFVNNQRVTGSQPLRPGDQIRIGDIVLAFELGAASGATVPAGAGLATDWEAELWDDDHGRAGGQDRGRNLLVWGLVGVIVVLILGGIGAALLLRKDATPTPEADVTTAPTSAIVVVASPTPGQAVTQPTEAPLVDLPTVAVEPIDTVSVDTGASNPTVPPVAVPSDAAQAIPKSIPVSSENLEQLPAMITQFLGDVPPEQLPQVISEQMGNLSPEQLQTMIGSLFPGVDPAQLPQVIAASFPGLSQSEIEALLGQVFPGQVLSLPDMGGPVGGRIALGIWDSAEQRYDIYMVNALGGTPQLLIELASEPNFSPDNQWLVYYSGDPERLGLHLIRVDGSQDTSLTSSDQHGYPSFSPDGQRIVFHHYGQDTLYVINRDGSNERGIAQGQYPAWSPTGDQIAYRGCIGGGKCGLMVANADGSNPMQITTHANDAAPRWSPNGGQIAFHSDRDGNWEIYVINSDGSWLRRITTNPTTDVMPVWSPDGLRIAFRSDRGGKGGVWLTSGIGGVATKLLDADIGPDWAFDQMDWAK